MRSLLLLAALFAAPAIAEPPVPSPVWKPVLIDKFGGLNILSDSTHIDGDGQVAQNVLTDNGYLEKRTGNVRLATLLAGSSVQYANEWVAPSGTRYLVAQASSTIYQTNFSGNPVALSTVTAGATLTTVPAFSKIEFADGYRALWYWNGNSTATATDPGSGNAAPICTLIDYKDARLWCANLPSGFTTPGNTTNGGGASTVLTSSTNGDGYWAVPSNAALVENAPNRFDFNPDDGDSVLCLKATPWGEFVGKRYSSYIVKGNGNLSYVPRLLDPKIGCVDNRSVQMVYGVLEWLAVDGVYGYDGSGPPHLLTRDLDPLMQTVREATYSQGNWSTQLLPDWQGGTQSTTTKSLPATPWDFTTLPGQIQPSSFTLYDDNTNPGIQSNGQIMGFSSDTLVNIDTTTFPLSIGLVQVAPSSAGVQVWGSTFPGTAPACYATGKTTWTALSGSPVCANGNGVSFGGSQTNQLYTMANSTGSTPGVNGWNYGYWSLSWFANNGSGGYGDCDVGVGNNCLDFAFVADKTFGSSWNGYNLNVTQGVYSGGSGGSGTLVLTLSRYASGSPTTMGSGTYSYIEAASQTYSTFSVTVTPGGYFTVWVGSSPLFYAYDAAANTRQSNLASINLYNHAIKPVVTNVSLNGYGAGSITSRIFNTGMAAPFAGLLSSTYTLTADGATSISFKVRDSTSPNNDLWSAYTTTATGKLATLPLQYWQYLASFNTTVASETANLTSVALPAVTTGYYYSQVDFVGSLITAWKQFNVTEANPGVYNYWVRQATYSFPAGNTSISWVAQTANQNVNLSVSTPTYAQFRLDSTTITFNSQGATAAEPISAVFLRWSQGTNLPVASSTLERRYMLCVTISTTATGPDTCLIRQKTGKWVEWTINTTVGAMGLYNGSMIAADGGSSSKVWSILQPGVYEDDGAPINSQWVSEDYTDGLVFNNKVLHEFWVDATPVSGSSVTISYSVDKSSGFVPYTFTVDNGQGINPSLPSPIALYGSINKFVPIMTGYDQGRYIRVAFLDNLLDNYWRINAFQLYLEDRPRAIP